MSKFLKKKSNYCIILLCSLIISILIFTVIYNTSSAKDESVRSENGVSDLSAWDSGDSLALSGEWEFYWQQFLMKKDIDAGAKPDLYITVPSVWNNYKIDGENLPGIGYATYRLHVTGVKEGQSLAMRINPFSTAYNLYIDDALMASSGMAMTTEEGSLPLESVKIVEFTPNSSSIDIIVHISNFVYARGGAWNSIYIGNPSQINGMNSFVFARDVSFISIFFIVALFCLYIFSLRKDKAMLLFAIICLLFALRTSFYGDLVAYMIFPSLKYEVAIKAVYFTTYWMPTVCFVLLYILYPEDISKKTIAVVLGYALFVSAATTAIPLYTLTQFAQGSQIIAAAISLYAIYRLVIAAKNRRADIIPVLLGVIFIAFCEVRYMLFANNIISNGLIEYSPFGFFMLTILWGYVLSRRYSRVRVNVEKALLVKEESILDEEGTAHPDQFTGLLNRELFLEELRVGISVAKKTGKQVAVLSLDIDEFRMVNEMADKVLGDSVLIEVEWRIMDTLRHGDAVARIGDDGFRIMLVDLKEEKFAEVAGKRVMVALMRPFIIGEYEFSISACIGCAVCPVNGENPETLIANADEALQIAKEKGKSEFICYSAKMKANAIEAIKMTSNLYRALERGEFELYYQPQIDMQHDSIVGMEALIRWNNPEMGIIGPSKFIPIAEKTRLIIQIGEWVLRTACGQNKQWQDSGLARFPISVNLSVHQLADENLLDKIKRILQETGLASEYIELEITESIAIIDIVFIKQVLESIKSLGIKIAIDDFGQEYSSLKYLNYLPIDKIKIDKSFIDGVGTSTKSEGIIRTVIALAKNLNLKVIAEGVETKQQLEFLANEGCCNIQGYYFYRPMPVHEIEKLIINSPKRDLNFR